MKTLVVLPSYNERQNIVDLVQAILDGAPAIDADVCVVDDSSPDGTPALIEEALGARPGWRERVHLIVRDKKDGRGGAVRAGFAWGAARGGYGAFVEMDCDFSHEPGALGQGLALLAQGYDVVIGARYPDGTIIGWPLSRRVFSFLANRLARLLLDPSIPDYTNGFRFYRPDVVDELLHYPQKHKGYIYLSETLSHLIRSGRRVGAFPIRFRNRERGTSNTSLREIRSALTGIVAIAIDHRLRRQ
jgi:glycosyltransferase involved in cell wall biosynthesis